MPPHDLNDRVTGNDGLLVYFFSLFPQALFGIAAFAQLLAVFLVAVAVATLVILILQMIILAIIKFVKRRYDAIKAHYTRTYDCEYCIAQRSRQALVQDDGPHIKEEETTESFYEDARTIVGEEHGNISIDLTKKSKFEEHNPLLTCDGEHSIEEDEETFHEDARMIVEEGNSESSIDLNEKTESDERNPLLEYGGQRTINRDKESFDKEGQKSFEEEHDMSFVDFNKCYSGAQ